MSASRLKILEKVQELDSSIWEFLGKEAVLRSRVWHRYYWSLHKEFYGE